MWRARVLVAGEAIQLQQTLVAIEQRLEQAPPERILWHIGKLLNHWDDRKTAGEKQMIVADWCEDLAEFSEAQIAEACREWRRTETFKPKIADIVALAENIRARDRESLRKTRVLLGLENPRPWEKIPAPEPERTSRPIAGLLKGMTKKLLAPGAANRDPAPPLERAKIDETLASRDPAAVAQLGALRKRAAT